MTDSSTTSRPEWPGILDRYVREVASNDPEHMPRRLLRRYHGVEVNLWYGRIHVDDVEGWVENIRLKHYLRSWQVQRGSVQARPTTDDIYDIMTEADREETAETKKPFHIERLARNIATNGVQEPILVFSGPNARGELWDGNRRFYATRHIMNDPKFVSVRDRVKWIPAYIYSPSGDPEYDNKVKHNVLTELNFKEKDHIPWPAYVKAGEIHTVYHRLTKEDPTDPSLRRAAKEQIAEEYGLKGWRTADRWIKMFDLSSEFKEYHEEEHSRSEPEVELTIQDKFEYFDELSKAGVWGSLSSDPDARDEVFDWLWDEKFKAFADVRKVPRILADPVARSLANSDHSDAVKKAIEHVIANDPTRVKDKTAANLKIKQFAEWLDTFKREDFRQLDAESLVALEAILRDVVKMLGGLLSEETSEEVVEND